MSEIYNNHRLLKNTFFLYGRMAATMLLNLLATRLVLENLGVTDMGIYAVLGSVVSTITVFGSSINWTVQRFMVFELGKKKGDINNVFNSCLNGIIFLVFFFVILLETVGLWLLISKLNIPEYSRLTAILAYQFCIVTFIVDTLSIPYDSVIVAHEKMNIFAVIAILKSALTCCLAFFISYFDNRLLIYAIGLMLVSVSIRLIYQIYCRIKFPEEIKYCKRIDKNVLSKIGKYFGITSSSSIIHIVSHQGIVWTINLLYDVGLNAVYNIANQLKNMMLSFSMNINRAISPQITKTYANGMIEEYKILVNVGMRLNSFMTLLLLFPFIFFADKIMEIWLKEVPEYTVFFVQMIALSAFFDSVMQSIGSAVFACGRIKYFLLITRTFYLLVLPLMIYLHMYTLSPKSVICSVVLMDFFVMLLQMTIVSKQGIVEVKTGLIIPILRIGAIALCSLLISVGLKQVLPHNIVGVVCMFVLHACAIVPFMFYVGTTYNERNLISHKAKSIINTKLRNKR